MKRDKGAAKISHQGKASFSSSQKEERFCMTCNSTITQGECKVSCWQDAKRVEVKHVRG